MAVADDLEVLEKSIRHLQVEWEKFFAGVEKKPPNEMKARVETLIRRHANAEIRNNTERFRYQTLQARYNTFNELWAKKLRAREEGRPLGVHGARAHAVPPAPPPPPPPSAAEAAAAARAEARPGGYRVQDVGRDAEAVRRLFDSYVAARTASGEGGAVKFESFQKVIAQQSQRILSEKGGAAVEFRLETRDGKVSLKARSVR